MTEQVWYPYHTPLGLLVIGASDKAITAVRFGEEPCPHGEKGRNWLTDLAAAQIEEYAAGRRKRFQLPLAPAGTPFQRAVWQALETIPYGETRSYRQIARQVGSPDACRAVGMANHRNPIPIFIPCHRVIGAKGALTGYAGGLEMKRKLLELEARHR